MPLVFSPATAESLNAVLRSGRTGGPAERVRETSGLLERERDRAAAAAAAAGGGTEEEAGSGPRVFSSSRTAWADLRA